MGIDIRVGRRQDWRGSCAVIFISNLKVLDGNAHETDVTTMIDNVQVSNVLEACCNHKVIHLPDVGAQS